MPSRMGTKWLREKEGKKAIFLFGRLPSSSIPHLSQCLNKGKEGSGLPSVKHCSFFFLRPIICCEGSFHSFFVSGRLFVCAVVFALHSSIVLSRHPSQPQYDFQYKKLLSFRDHFLFLFRRLQAEFVYQLSCEV